MATIDDEPKKQCENCKNMFPESKVQLHEAYCLRNIRKCPKCDKFVDKREMDEHNEEFHLKITCDKCGESQENQAALAKHQDTQCRMRPKQCSYCKVDFPASEFSQHEYICGSRTKLCGLCNKNILMRDYENHMDTCVGVVEQPKPQRVVEKRQQQPQVPVVQTSLNTIIRQENERNIRQPEQKPAQKNDPVGDYKLERKPISSSSSSSNNTNNNIPQQQPLPYSSQSSSSRPVAGRNGAPLISPYVSQPTNSVPAYAPQSLNNQLQQQQQQPSQSIPSSSVSKQLDKNKIQNIQPQRDQQTNPVNNKPSAGGLPTSQPIQQSSYGQQNQFIAQRMPETAQTSSSSASQNKYPLPSGQRQYSSKEGQYQQPNNPAPLSYADQRRREQEISQQAYQDQMKTKKPSNINPPVDENPQFIHPFSRNNLPASQNTGSNRQPNSTSSQGITSNYKPPSSSSIPQSTYTSSQQPYPRNQTNEKNPNVPSSRSQQAPLSQPSSSSQYPQKPPSQYPSQNYQGSSSSNYQGSSSSNYQGGPSSNYQGAPSFNNKGTSAQVPPYQPLQGVQGVGVVNSQKSSQYPSSYGNSGSSSSKPSQQAPGKPSQSVSGESNNRPASGRSTAIQAASSAALNNIPSNKYQNSSSSLSTKPQSLPSSSQGNKYPNQKLDQDLENFDEDSELQAIIQQSLQDRKGNSSTSQKPSSYPSKPIPKKASQQLYPDEDQDEELQKAIQDSIKDRSQNHRNQPSQPKPLQSQHQDYEEEEDQELRRAILLSKKEK